METLFCVRCQLYCYTYFRRISCFAGRAMAQAVSSRPPTKVGPCSTPGQCMRRFWWTKWHCDGFCSSFPPVSVVRPMLHTHLDIHVALTRRTNRWNLGTFQKAMLFWKLEENWIELYLHFMFRAWYPRSAVWSNFFTSYGMYYYYYFSCDGIIIIIVIIIIIITIIIIIIIILSQTPPRTTAIS